MASPYVCLGVGTNQTHRTVITAYAEAHGLDTHECANDYICVGVGGAQAEAHRKFLTTYAEAHGLEHNESETPCP